MCSFFASQRFHEDSPCRARFGTRVLFRGKNGARFKFDFVFNEGMCLNKGTSPRMSCLGRTAHHPSWHMVR